MMQTHELATWWGGHPGPDWGWGPFGWIFPAIWLALWAVVAGLLIWYLVAGRRHRALDDARRILAERYARGELSPDEYRERLGQLR